MLKTGALITLEASIIILCIFWIGFCKLRVEIRLPQASQSDFLDLKFFTVIVFLIYINLYFNFKLNFTDFIHCKVNRYIYRPFVSGLQCATFGLQHEQHVKNSDGKTVWHRYLCPVLQWRALFVPLDVFKHSQWAAMSISAGVRLLAALQFVWSKGRPLHCGRACLPAP